MGTTYNKQFAIQGEDNLYYYRVDYLLKHYLGKSHPRINRILKTYQTDGDDQLVHVSKSKGKYFRDQSGPLRFIEVAFWNQIVSDQSMFSKYSKPFGNHERLGDHCPGLYFNKIDCLHNMQSQDHQCLGQTCKDVKGKCPVHPCRPAIHETDQYIYADHFPTTRTVPDEWFVMKNSSEINMVISKMNMIGDRYKDSANDRAVRAEGLCDFMYKLREEEREQYKEQVKKEREQYKEQVKEEREQHKKEREQYKEQVAMLTKKLELLPFKDRKRLDKLYRKKKAEERKLKELEELEEFEECDSEEE